VCGLGVYPFGRPFFDDLAAVENEDPMRQMPHDWQVVRDEQITQFESFLKCLQ
jgi:hypothetical protein